ncbi:glycoside hydrolase family 3 N-terminal domain-containing protein [uncultured Draconibacterium sp.]|uniref:glycoside hydrolase family 3 N-terminal domain-containing protein n=1 Tax=uncultured Draconibacterium sp. TaxID=1573823 RepID=UPI0025E5AADA|nr:glycoside hydrolase family 3 N-terminal domain-containing protein [uncultured Draconibacterium sp.]
MDLNAIVDSMSVQQKAQLVVGTGLYFVLPEAIKEQMPERFAKRPEGDSVYVDMVERVRKYLPGTAGVTAEFSTLGITSQTLADGPAGLRISPRREGSDSTFFCTAFPIATLLASTWDTKLVEQVGNAMGEESLEYGADILLAPGMNIQRDPLCGRNFEYYSEDPLVTGKMAASMVKGIQSNGVGASVKHFAVNNQETYRASADAIVSERALREIYLKGFEIVVKEAQPWTVMSAYNKINGSYASESKELLTDVLRNEWGFDGYVVTDWGAGNDIIKQIKAGNDMIQPGSFSQVKEIIEAVESGTLDLAELDKNIERILGVMVNTPRYRKYLNSNKPDLKANALVARQAAADGMVLLENRNETLPLASDVGRIAVFGNTSYDFISGGTGSGDVNEASTVSLTQGLVEKGYQVNKELHTVYSSYLSHEKAKQHTNSNPILAMFTGPERIEELVLTSKLISNTAQTADIALITIGRLAGEGGDRKLVEGDYYLSRKERELLKNVTTAFHKVGKKVIVVLNVPGVIETTSWSEIPDAVLCAWQPGQEAGNAVTDILTGKINPSGKLAITFPAKYEDGPTAAYFPGKSIDGKINEIKELSGFSINENVPWQVIYGEDIYVGYRYYNTFNVPVAYEFGYGLSYTNFQYDKLNINRIDSKDIFTISVEVTNTGNYPGKEVVQVYSNPPSGEIEKPKDALIAFGKTKLLQPGESETLILSARNKDLACFNPRHSQWMVESGEYKIKVGPSSRKTKLEANILINDDVVIEKVNNVLSPKIEFDKMHRR